MTDERYDLACKLAADISAKSEELSTAIYEASKYGYVAKIGMANFVQIAEGSFIGTGDGSLIIRATIPFDIGRAV